MAGKKAVASQDLGLELGLLMARYLLGTEDLHYGLWSPETPVNLANLPKAQDAYTDFLLSRLPSEPCSILDVGCGAGVISDRLVNEGHTVQCVSPPSDLLERAKAKLDGRAKVHEMGFEDLQTDDRFDVVLFSESFQYVRCREGLKHAKSLLKPDGRIVICDFFKRLGKTKGPIGGGHKLNHLTESIEQHGLHVHEDVDITDETAPNLDLVDEFMRKVGEPAYRATMRAAQRGYPLSTRLTRWLFRKKLAKMEYKYFSGLRNAESFKEYKTYRLFMLKMVEAKDPTESSVEMMASR